MNSSVSKKEIDKKSIMFLFDLYKQKIPKQIKLTFDQQGILILVYEPISRCEPVCKPRTLRMKNSQVLDWSASSLEEEP